MRMETKKYKLLITRTENAEMEVEARSQVEAREICKQRVNDLISTDELNSLSWQRDGGIHIDTLS